MEPHTAVRSRAFFSRPTFWIGVVLTFLLAIPFAATGGFGGVLVLLGLLALITGLYTVITKRRSWAGLPSSRKAGGIALSGGLVVMIAGGALLPPSSQTPPAEAESTATTSATATAGASPLPAVTETPIDGSSCQTASVTRVQGGREFTCTTDELGELVWMTTEKAAKLVAVHEAAAKKGAADRAAAQKAAEEKAAEEKAAAEAAEAKKAAAAKAAAEKKAAEKKAAGEAAAKAAADQAAADKLAADKLAAAAKADADRTAAEKAAVSTPELPAAPQPAEDAAVVGYVHPGSFCNGGTGVSKTGKPMVCAPAKDGRNRWQSAG